MTERRTEAVHDAKAAFSREHTLRPTTRSAHAPTSTGVITRARNEEAIRSLKHQISNTICRHLVADAAKRPGQTPSVTAGIYT
jgi:hypothetical protein